MKKERKDKFIEYHLEWYKLIGLEGETIEYLGRDWDNMVPSHRKTALNSIETHLIIIKQARKAALERTN